MEVHFLTQADVMGLEQNLGLHAYKKLMISGGNCLMLNTGVCTLASSDFAALVSTKVYGGR